MPKYTKNKEWALEFIAMCCSHEWQKRAMVRGNAPPLRSVLRGSRDGGADRLAAGGRAGDRDRRSRRPAHPVWDTLEVQMRSAMSQALLGQKTAKVALDELAADWQRSLRRAGVGRG